LPGLSAVLLGGAVLACIVSCGAPSRLAQEGAEATPTELVSASPRKVDFGVLPRGGKREATIRLTNHGAAAVELAAVKTTCECLEVVVSKKALGPGETVTAEVRVNFTTDPKFTGPLAMEATGHVKQSKVVAFTIAVDVKVE
jgi:hypothetical protein